MPKLTLTDIENLENQPAVITAINNNNAAIEAAMEKTLSRDGTSPNQLVDDVDMNSNRIINLPAATTATEPVRYAEFQGAVSGALGLSDTGIVVALAPDEIITVEIEGTAGEITVTNGTGEAGNPTISLPDSLDFTGKTVTGGTFTGLTFTAEDNAFIITDDVDVTKQLKFQTSGITTGTTRTLTILDADTTIVGTDTTQTLTNKTLTAPVISTISNTGLLSLPTSTDTLVGRATTDTLTNKTLTSPVINTPTGIVKGDVGLGNVDNTSDATKNAAIATLTNKTLTAPVINSPTGLVKADVGLGNVDNTSDATKNAAVATLTNKTLTSPVINTPTGIVKGDVGLGNVDNTSDATKNSATATLTNKTLVTPDITTGFTISSSATSGQYARGNGTNFVSSAIQAADLPVIPTTSGSTSSAFGAVKVDGTTITASASGVLTAVGATAVAQGFRAHKNGTDQTGIANSTATKVTFGTEVFDDGSYYDTTNSRFTPPAGIISVSGNVYLTSGVTSGSVGAVYVYKNGSLLTQTPFVGSSANSATAAFTVVDDANGTDYYEVWVYAVSASTSTIDGGSASTYFMSRI